MTVEAARTAAAAFISCRLDWIIVIAVLQSAGHSTAQVVVCAERHCTTDHWHATPWSSRTYHANSIGCPSENVLSSKCHDWLASRCPGRRISTWQTTAASCPTPLGALCSQLTFRLAWCHEHSAVTARELLQPRYLACETLFRSSCAIQTLPTDCSDDSWRDTFFGNHEHDAFDFFP